MKKRKLLVIALMICMIGGGMMLFFFMSELIPRLEAEDTYEEIRSEVFQNNQKVENVVDEESQQTAITKEEPKLKWRTGPPDFDSLMAWNTDIVGWIYSPGTTIDYPIVKGVDNSYYLNHTVDKRKSVIGSIFMESANAADFTDDITILYGHHIKGGRMFSSLSGYKSQSYYNQHPEMILYTRDKTYNVLLFAGNVINGEIGTFPIRFGPDPERSDWINQCLQNSTFRSNIVPDIADKMIVLCTCTYEYTDARYIVYGILREQEIDKGENDED